jgi:hypothetical protein
LAALWFGRVVLAVWFVALLGLLPLGDYSDSILRVLVATMVPGILLVVFLMAVFVWHIAQSFTSLRRGQTGRAWKHIGIVLCGIAAIPAGRHLGDAVVLACVAGPLKAATLAPDPAASAPPIEATKTAAIYIADSAFFTMQGIAYDSTGRLGDLLTTDPSRRPPDWQSAMPENLRGHGYPRHLYGNYWKVTMSKD